MRGFWVMYLWVRYAHTFGSPDTCSLRMRVRIGVGGGNRGNFSSLYCRLEWANRLKRLVCNSMTNQKHPISPINHMAMPQPTSLGTG
ncbi:hypothetical protein N657DRAFT_313925 [Parathielavia appendiculata]|uniref:Uncharacterized protein n=1 Tax=Parathielavia appendiculata TaxID=2587402 RepID=A0AAN6Z5M4_9PEZI|nr:hypothetical protein N657DRAFT_313925 [Parathielavia appendiculata]